MHCPDTGTQQPLAAMVHKAHCGVCNSTLGNFDKSILSIVHLTRIA